MRNAVLDFNRTILDEWVAWLAENNARGYLGEIGWPSTVTHPLDAFEWQVVGQHLYGRMFAENVAWSYFAGSIATGGANQLIAYTGNTELDTARSQAATAEYYADSHALPRGYNHYGATFGVSPHNNAIDESAAVYPSSADFAYMASRGFKTVRLGIRWERIQRTLGGALHAGEMAKIDAAIAAAGANGIGVILNLGDNAKYEYGALSGDPATTYTLTVESGSLTQAHFIDVWRRLSDKYKANTNVIAYGLMNEPFGITSEGGPFVANAIRHAFAATVEGWSREGGAALTHSGVVGHTAAGSASVSYTFSAGFDTGLRLVANKTSPSDWSGSGSVLGAWVYVDGAFSGTLEAEFFVYNNAYSATYGNKVALVADTWVWVPGAFSAAVLAEVRDYGLAFTGNTVNAAKTIRIDDVEQGEQVIYSGDEVWEVVSQAVVSDLRTTKADTKLVMVSGHQYSVTSNWTTAHPDGWITDSANNFRYEAHQYLDTEGGGYSQPFSYYDALWTAEGYGPIAAPVPAITFDGFADAFTATALPVELFVRIGGEVVDATEASISFGVDRPVGTCTVYVESPRPATAEMNASIEVEMGYPGASARRFLGFIPSDESVVDDRGRLVRIEGVDTTARLAYPSYDGIEIEGPVSLKDAFRSLAELRGLTYLSDDTTATDGVTEIVLGGNDLVNGGHIRIDNRTAPLDWLQRVPPAFGYRVFGCPDGATRQARVSGLATPNEDETPPVFQEGVNCFHIAHERDIRDMATYIEVKGARYNAEDGGVVEIRAIPESVPYAEELDPPGYRKHTISLQDIVTDEQAQWVRNATEVDRAAPFELISWEAPGRADMQPGDVVTINAPTHGITSTDYWLMSVDESVDGRGYIGRYTAWRGAGEALAKGNDCRTEAVPGDTVIHAGTQTISWYRDPSPDSVRDPLATDQETEDRRWVVPIDITVTDADYSSLRLTGLCHGTNSRGTRQAITGSKVEVWQLEDPSLSESGSNEFRRVGSVDLPTTNEEYYQRRNYSSSDRYWTAFSLPMPGTLKEGAARLYVVCGEYQADGSDVTDVDDFELKDLRLTYCGVGEPALPGGVAS